MTNENTSLQSTPQTLMALAIEKGADMAQLEKLMDLQERWEAKQAKKAFLQAMSTFQSLCPVLEKNKKVDFSTKAGGRMNYSYSDLGEIDSAIKIPLEKCGLSKRWEISDVSHEIKVDCIISHVDGHSEITSMTAAKDDSGMKNSIQAKGSTITYLQRYTLIGALGITTANADVDGHKEGGSEDAPAAFDPATATIEFGKHKGCLYKDLPADYLAWLAEKGRDEEKEKVKQLYEYLNKVAPQASAAGAPKGNQRPADFVPTPFENEIRTITNDPFEIEARLTACENIGQVRVLFSTNQDFIEKHPQLHAKFTAKRKEITPVSDSGASDKTPSPFKIKDDKKADILSTLGAATSVQNISDLYAHNSEFVEKNEGIKQAFTEKKNQLLPSKATV